MPAVIALLMRALGMVIVPLGWKLLKGLGFAAVSYVGISAAMDQIKSLILAKFGALPADWLSILGMLQIDVVFNIILSALVARTVLRGTNGSGSKTTYKWGS